MALNQLSPVPSSLGGVNGGVLKGRWEVGGLARGFRIPESDTHRQPGQTRLTGGGEGRGEPLSHVVQQATPLHLPRTTEASSRGREMGVWGLTTPHSHGRALRVMTAPLKWDGVGGDRKQARGWANDGGTGRSPSSPPTHLWEPHAGATEAG